MGRLSHITRLALGRSAFEDPVRDENGDFVINSHVFDHSAAGYVQAFNDHGRPMNAASARSERRLRRAQNEILQTVGVVRSRHDLERELTGAHGLTKRQLRELVTYESSIGSLLRIFWALPMDLSAWWIISCRCRSLAFQRYLQPGLMSALHHDASVLGTSAFFGSGLLYSMGADEVRTLRAMFAPGLHASSSLDLAQEITSGRTNWVKALDRLKDILLFSIEWPLRTFSSLQRVGLIPFSSSLSRSQFFALFAQSPNQLLAPGFDGSLSGLSTILLSIICSPFVLSYAAERVRESLEVSIRFLLYQAVTHHSHPDRISMATWDPIDSTVNVIPIQDFGTRSVGLQLRFRERLSLAFPWISNAADFFGLPYQIDFNASDIKSFFSSFTQQYRSLSELNSRKALHSRQSEEAIRKRAMERAFDIAFVETEQDVQAWADDVSTATPDINDLFERDHDESALRLRSPRPESFIPATPLQNLLEPIELPELAAIVPGPSSPPTPVPGLSRAPSLSQAPSRPTSRPPPTRPVRRPTELDDNISAIASSLRNDRLQRPASRSTRDHRRFDPPTTFHRLTTLTTFPEDSLAHYGSVVITSMIMLPFDVYYIHRLASTFLTSQSVSDQRSVALAGDLISFKLNGRGVGSVFLPYAGRIALTFAIEALTRSFAWFVGARVATYIGQNYFLWGKA